MKQSKILGLAFLLQAVTSIVSGAVLLKPLLVADDISASMGNIANSPQLITASIIGDVITAMGIIFLGAVLFISLRKQNEQMALIAFGLYIFEAGILAVSRIEAFTLLRISQEYVVAGADVSSLEFLGKLALESMDFGYRLHILPFGIGAILFYYLIHQARIVPSALALWGLFTAPLVFIGALIALFGFESPTLLYIPYAPFEFVIGIWLLLKAPIPALE